MKPVRLEINGETVSGIVLKQGSVVWAHVNGRTLVYETESTRSQKKRQHVEDPTKILAPMPGKIIKVLCAEGDQVKKDQTLVVMEAMKMEYALKAQANGRVKRLTAAPGSQATLGDLLAELEVGEA